MPGIPRRFAPRSSPRQAAYVMGIAIWIISFLLPGVRGPETFPGWRCALMALQVPFCEQYVDSVGLKVILFVCGLINPLVVGYLVLPLYDVPARSRRVLAAGTLGLIPLNWIYMAYSNPPLTPLIGHFAWIAGMVLVLAPEALFGSGKTSA